MSSVTVTYFDVLSITDHCFPRSWFNLLKNLLLTGRLGTKSLVVNTKWPLHLSILPWFPVSPFTVHTCMCAESCPKECFYKPFKRFVMRLNRLRGKQWSEILRTSKYVTVTLGTDEERINLLYIQTYSWKEKLAV